MKSALMISTMIILFISCSDNKNYSRQEYAVNFSNAGTIKLDDFIESVEYVSLEFTEHSALGSVLAVYYDDENWIIHSRDVIYMFDDQGSYKCKIDKKGRARDEYIKITAMNIDSTRDCIIVYDSGSKKLILYSYNGSHIKTIDDFGDMETYPIIDDIIPLVDGTYLCAADLHYGAENESLRPELWITDADGTILKNLYIANFTHPTIEPKSLLHRTSSNDVIYLNYEDDSDYLYRDGELHHVRRYDIKGPQAGDYKGLGNSQYGMKYWVNGDTYHNRMSSAFEGDYVFTTWSDTNANSSKEWYSVLLNIRSNQLTVGRELDYMLSNSQKVYPTNIVDKIYPILGLTQNNIEGVMVSVIYPANVADAALCKLLDVTEEDAINMNPIIQLLKIKK